MRQLVWFLLCCTLLGSLGVMTHAATAHLILQPGQNWIALPIVPYSPNPSLLFDGLDIDANLTKFDSMTQTEIRYSAASPEQFGNLLLAEGYKITNFSSAPVTIIYQGYEDGVPPTIGGPMTDMWVSLPGASGGTGGKHWIGQPFYHDTPIASMFVTNGITLTDVAGAVAKGWIDPLWTGFDAQTQTPFTVGLAAYGAQDTFFRACSMYEITTHQSNLALIIPGQAVPEPSGLAILACGLVALPWMRRQGK